MAQPKKSKNSFPAVAVEPPKLTDREWYFTSALGVVFIVMAAMQLITFGNFKDSLAAMGISSVATAGAIIVLAELWGSAALFKLKLSTAFRVASGIFAVLVSCFWFYESVRLVSNGSPAINNSGFLGGFFTQLPSWWTIVEATVLLFWTLWAVSRTQAKR